MSELQSMCGNLTGQGGYTARRRVRAMPNFYEYNPEQGYLLPPSVRDVLGKEHLCFFVHCALEKMDLPGFEGSYSEQGHPGYKPALLLKICLYAYRAGITSLQRVEQRIRADLAFRS